MTHTKLTAATIVTVLGLMAAGLNAQQVTPSTNFGDTADTDQRFDAAAQQVGFQQEQYPTQSVPDDESFRLYRLSSMYYAEDKEEKKDTEEEEEKTDVEKQLEELKSSVKDLEDANKEVETALKTFTTVGTSKATIKISGRLHGDYWAFPGADEGIDAFEGRDPEDRFLLRRARFGVAGDITDNTLYKIEMEFADPNNAQFRDVYIGLKNLPILRTVLIGNQKRPYGLDELNSSRYLIFMERPLISEADDEGQRRLGICSYGLSEDQAWNWRYGVFNLENIQNDGVYIGDHYQLQMAGRLANTIWYDEYSDGRGYAHWGVAGSIAYPDGNDQGGETNANEAIFRTRPEAVTTRRWLDTDRIDFANDFELGTLESVINVGPFQVGGEYQYIWLNRTNALSDLQFNGYWGYVAYMLTGEHVPWERESGTLGRVKPFENFFLVDTTRGYRDGGWGAWQVAARYSNADLTDDDITGGVGNAVTIGLNWYWNTNAKMMFNYVYGHIDERGPIDGFSAGDYSILGTRFAVDF